jgi:glycosyltransferase involved in cell wall biosynthesis
MERRFAVMRVATLCSNLGIGGDENRVLSFARTADRRRVEHHLIVTSAPPRDPGACDGMIGRYQALGVPLHCLDEMPRWMQGPRGPLGAVRDAARLLRIVAKLARLLRRLRIQVLDARLMSGILYGVPAGVAGRVPVIIGTTYQADEWNSGPERWMRPGLFSGLDVLVSDSEWAIARHRALFGDSVRWAAIPNGIPDPIPDHPRDEVRRRLGIPGDVTVIAQVANFHPYKGHRILLDAMAGVLARHPETWFLFCGHVRENAAHVAGLRDQARRLGVGHRLVITTYPGNIGDVWSAVDIQAHASTRDSSPISIHESMARSRPAVVTSVGGIPELVADGESAIVVPPGDAGALAAALTALLDDPARARRLGLAARARYEARHRPEIMTRAIEDLMSRELDRARQRRSARAAL